LNHDTLKEVAFSNDSGKNSAYKLGKHPCDNHPDRKAKFFTNFGWYRGEKIKMGEPIYWCEECYDKYYKFLASAPPLRQKSLDSFLKKRRS
jgi:hypothetical protein